MNQAITKRTTHMTNPVLPIAGGLYKHYLNRNLEVMEYAVRLYGKVFALRFDLRVPLEYNYDDTNLVTRFISSLKAQLNAHYQRKLRQSKSYVHTTDLLYVWTREEGSYGKPHYHFCIFLNGNAHSFLGRIELGRDNMYNRIVNAWRSALGTHSTLDSAWAFDPCLVSIPPNCEYLLEREKPGFNRLYKDLYKRLSYLTKVESKSRGDGVNCYGTNRVPKAVFHGV